MSNKYDVDMKEIDLYTTRLEDVDLTLVLGLDTLSHTQLQSLHEGIQEELEERGLDNGLV